MALPMDGVLERLLRANEDQAKSTGALVELQRATTEQLATIRDNNEVQTGILRRLVDRMDDDEASRHAAVEAVKEHTEKAIKLAFSSSEMWWRKAFIVATALIMIGQFLQVGIKQWLDMVSHQ